jgi:DNA-binding MarR family transcriptional regulator
MGLTRQSVQQTADSLEKKGLIGYRENPHHRRAKLMVLTVAGRKALDYVLERQAVWVNAIGTKQSLSDLNRSVAVLRQLRADLEPEDYPTPDWRRPAGEPSETESRKPHR